jgi:DNA-binding response OmpR family regulator
MSAARGTAPGRVALFNASDDTIDMMQGLLSKAGAGQVLMSCHFADLKKGIVDFDTFMADHNPDVVIFDLSPPYDENWQFFKKMRHSETMRDRGVVLTTTNKDRLDEVLGADSHAFEVVGKADDLARIGAAIKSEAMRAHAIRVAHGQSGPATAVRT